MPASSTPVNGRNCAKNLWITPENENENVPIRPSLITIYIADYPCHKNER